MLFVFITSKTAKSENSHGVFYVNTISFSSLFYEYCYYFAQNLSNSLSGTDSTHHCTEIASFNFSASHRRDNSHTKIFSSLIVSVNVFFVHLLSLSRCFGLCVAFPSPLLGIRQARKRKKKTRTVYRTMSVSPHIMSLFTILYQYRVMHSR